MKLSLLLQMFNWYIRPHLLSLLRCIENCRYILLNDCVTMSQTNISKLSFIETVRLSAVWHANDCKIERIGEEKIWKRKPTLKGFSDIFYRAFVDNYQDNRHRKRFVNIHGLPNTCVCYATAWSIVNNPSSLNHLSSTPFKKHTKSINGTSRK